MPMIIGFDILKADYLQLVGDRETYCSITSKMREDMKQFIKLLEENQLIEIVILNVAIICKSKRFFNHNKINDLELISEILPPKEEAIHAMKKATKFSCENDPKLVIITAITASEVHGAYAKFVLIASLIHAQKKASTEQEEKFLLQTFIQQKRIIQKFQRDELILKNREANLL